MTNNKVGVLVTVAAGAIVAAAISVTAGNMRRVCGPPGADNCIPQPDGGSVWINGCGSGPCKKK